jgi:hemin uptake protein HemP
MRWNTRLIAVAIAATSMLAVMAGGTVAILDRGTAMTKLGTSDPRVTRLRAAIRTEWLSPADARRSLETRSAALADWLQARGGAVRIISSETLLRTHGADGSRLAIPLARFERLLEVQLPEGIEMAHTQRALLGPDGSVVIASARGTRHGQPPRPGSTALDF